MLLLLLGVVGAALAFVGCGRCPLVAAGLIVAGWSLPPLLVAAVIAAGRSLQALGQLAHRGGVLQGFAGVCGERLLASAPGERSIARAVSARRLGLAGIAAGIRRSDRFVPAGCRLGAGRLADVGLSNVSPGGSIAVWPACRRIGGLVPPVLVLGWLCRVPGLCLPWVSILAAAGLGPWLFLSRRCTPADLASMLRASLLAAGGMPAGVHSQRLGSSSSGLVPRMASQLIDRRHGLAIQFGLRLADLGQLFRRRPSGLCSANAAGLPLRSPATCGHELPDRWPMPPARGRRRRPSTCAASVVELLLSQPRIGRHLLPGRFQLRAIAARARPGAAVDRPPSFSAFSSRSSRAGVALRGGRRIQIGRHLAGLAGKLRRAGSILAASASGLAADFCAACLSISASRLSSCCRRSSSAINSAKRDFLLGRQLRLRPSSTSLRTSSACIGLPSGLRNCPSASSDSRSAGGKPATNSAASRLFSRRLEHLGQQLPQLLQRLGQLGRFGSAGPIGRGDRKFVRLRFADLPFRILGHQPVAQAIWPGARCSASGSIAR